LTLSTLGKYTSSDPCRPTAPQPPPCIVKPGQLIYAQLLPRTTIEGYTFGRGDSLNLLDPSLSEEAWPTVPRPAVVVQVSRNWRSKIVVKLAPITRRKLGDSMAQVLLTAGGDSGGTELATVLCSGWPQDSTWSYTFMHSAIFTCNPDQVRTSLISQRDSSHCVTL
jgi:hypothetical protein